MTRQPFSTILGTQQVLQYVNDNQLAHEAMDGLSEVKDTYTPYVLHLLHNNNII